MLSEAEPMISKLVSLSYKVIFSMTYPVLTYFHLVTVLFAFLLGTYLLFNHKGTPRHKMLGKLYMLLMMTTAIFALFMPATVGPSFWGHFGYIHLLCLLVLYTVPSAYLAARNGNVKKHRMAMINLYVGAILVAGGFTLMPGRLLHSWLFL